MDFFQLIKRDLRFYWRNNIGTLLLAMVCCAILTGALLVGDSVQFSLLRLGQMRLGEKTRFAMSTGDRFFRQELAPELQGKTESLLVVPVLASKGILESPDGSIRVNNLNIYGISQDFWNFIEQTGQCVHTVPVHGFHVSESVANRLSKIQGEFLLRMQLPSQLSGDLIFSTEDMDSQAWPMEIAGTILDEDMGRFSLQTLQEPPLNVFVPIDWLAEKIEQPGKANMLLCGVDGKSYSTMEEVSAVLKEILQPEDLGLDIRKVDDLNIFELRTSQVFLPEAVTEAATEAGSNAVGVFTYFVNEIRLGDKSVPYSTVTAQSENGILPALGKNEIAINEWLANELIADVGDEIQLTYFEITPTRKLVERTTMFKVKQVVPMMGPFADPSLMPEYPGLSEAGNCRDWEAGIPIDLKRIQQRDEDYWDRYRGTPKAYISLDTAREIWSSRFGTLTAVRYPAAENAEQQIRSALVQKIDLAQTGFRFQDVKSDARASAAGSTDFSGLFGGLSMFLIFSAAILLALVFVFYVESRADQIGLLLAVGWGWLKIFGLFMAEGAVLAMIGCVAGAVVSVLYSWGLIYLLNTTFWAKALASLQLVFHANILTLVTGVCVSFLICLFSIQLALFHRIRKPVHQLLTQTFEQFISDRKSFSRMPLWSGLLCLAGSVLLPLQSELKDSQTASFFMTGILLLLAVFFFSAYGLKWLRLKSTSFSPSLARLAVKNIPRRTGRSLIVLITLACGVFMVVAVGSNYKNIGAEVHRRDSATGGFSLMAQTTVPMTQIPELAQVNRDNMPLISKEAVVGFRVFQKDDASCLNLNRAAQPTLLGVQPERLAQKYAFAFQKTIDSEEGLSPWFLLRKESQEGVIPAIGDYATVIWGLRKNLSDTIEYTDESGRTIQLKIVGILKDSVLQGRLLISEEYFVEHFPSVDGSQLFLIDADWNDLPLQATQLTKQYRDFGMEVVPTVEQLARFHEVENTYLAIFLVLGGLGLILGSAGLGLVLVLNVLDRRAELAMMQAVGFETSDLRRMLFFEHVILLLAGVLGGLVPAMLAVYPVIQTQGADFPYKMILCLVLAMLVSGAVWVRIAIGWVLKTNFLETLRNQ